MKELNTITAEWFNNYCDSFINLSESQQFNFNIKKEHSLRVADIAVYLSNKLGLAEPDQQIAYTIGMLHDIGRFNQLVDFDTFNDSKSFDHAEKAVQILRDNNVPDHFNNIEREIIYTAILNHNKFNITNGLQEKALLHARLIRDADKLDIYKVLTDFYNSKDRQANHTLSWELPKGFAVNPAVAREVLAGKLVSKKNVISVIDVKVMQLSWVFDINFRPTFEYLLKNRFLEVIYNSLPKNDLIIEIYRKIKVVAENKIFLEHRNQE